MIPLAEEVCERSAPRRESARGVTPRQWAGRPSVIARATYLLCQSAGNTVEPGFVQVYALTSSHSPHETVDLILTRTHETVDLFLTREAAEAELREILQDEPDWKDALCVVPIELDGRTCRQTESPPGAARKAARSRAEAGRLGRRLRGEPAVAWRPTG